MNTQTTITAHKKAIAIIEMIERCNEIITDSEKYAQSKGAFQPVISYHRRNVEKYSRIAMRLQEAYINLKYKLSTTPVNLTYTSNLALPF